MDGPGSTSFFVLLLLSYIHHCHRKMLKRKCHSRKDPKEYTSTYIYITAVLCCAVHVSDQKESSKKGNQASLFTWLRIIRHVEKVAEHKKQRLLKQKGQVF